ncbi:hypothetical protein N8772_02845 [Rickettsiales bacterium]|nr:hypothetical protein [Rickettsiales bacterium]
MKKTGFGLVETSIIIAIISFMTVSALSLYKINLNQQKSTLEKLKEEYAIANIEHLDTRARFNKIYEAIKLFVIKNHRLPCPDHDADGVEDVGNNCDNSNIVTSTNIKYGDLPYQTLGLTTEFNMDEWNRNISYYVDIRFTFKSQDNNAIDGFAMEKTMHDINNDDETIDGRVIDDNFELIEITDGTNQIEPEDGLSNQIRPNASYLFILMSGGSDAARNNENIDNDDNLFTTEQGDILFFKNKQEILQDTGMTHFFCSINDSKITFNNDSGDNDGNLGSCNDGSEIAFDNVIHGANIYSITTCPCTTIENIIRKCEAYGIWQNITNMQINQCNQ